MDHFDDRFTIVPSATGKDKRNRSITLLIVVPLLLALIVFALQKTYQKTLAGADQAAASSTEDLPELPIQINDRLLGQDIEVWDTSVFDESSTANKTVDLVTSLRGPVSGLIGDFYHWEDPYGLLDETRKIVITNTVTEFGNVVGTLDYLRVSRDQNADRIVGVNIRGFPDWFNWPTYGGNNPYMTHDLNKLQELAADWLLYTNYTVQNFDQDNPPSASSSDELELRSAEILDSIMWQNPGGTNVRDKLPVSGESLPKIKYWEIGNEPNVPLGGYSLTPEQFAERYGVEEGEDDYTGITGSLLDMDRLINGRKTIAIGPALMGPASTEGFGNYISELVSPGSYADFISYHPYNQIYGSWYGITITQSTTCYTVPPGGQLYRAYTYRRVNNQNVALPDDANSWNADEKVFLGQQISDIHALQFD